MSAEELHDHLAGLGFEVATIRTRKVLEGDRGGPYNVVLRPGCTAERCNEAQAAAEAWSPTVASKVRIAARARGLTPLQLAVAAIEGARIEKTPIPPWAKKTLRAERLSDLDKDLSG